MTVSGERSSCEALATKSRRMFSSRASFVTSRRISSCRPQVLVVTRLHASQRSPYFGMWIRGAGPLPPLLDVLDELGVAQQVVDADAVVDLAAQVEPLARHAIEPEDLADRVRAGSRRRASPRSCAGTRAAASARGACGNSCAGSSRCAVATTSPQRPCMLGGCSRTAQAQPALEADQLPGLRRQRRRPR